MSSTQERSGIHRESRNSSQQKRRSSRRKSVSRSSSSGSDSYGSRHEYYNRDKKRRSKLNESHRRGRAPLVHDTSSYPFIIISNFPDRSTKEDLIKKLVEIKATYKNVLISSTTSKVAIIEFHNLDASDRFLDSTRGFLDISGNSLRVRYISTSEIRLHLSRQEDDTKIVPEYSDPCNVLILKGLDAYTTEEEVRNAVCHLTKKIVYDVRLIKEKISNVSRGFCFVELGNVDDAKILMHFLKTMSPPFSINGRKISMGYARNNFGFSCNARVNSNSVASNAIAAARAASSVLPPHLQDDPKLTSNYSDYTSVTFGDPQDFAYDPCSGYYIDPNSGIYHDRNTGTFYNPYTQDFLYIDQITNTLIPFAKNTVELKVSSGTSQLPVSKEKISKSNPTNEASKISCDMERWAKRVNQETTIKNISKKQHIHEVQEIQKQTVKLKEKIDAQELFNTLSSVPCNSIDNKDKVLLDQTLDNDPHLSLPDLACLLCQRKFPSKEVLIKHVTSSNLHITNLQNVSKT